MLKRNTILVIISVILTLTIIPFLKKSIVNAATSLWLTSGTNMYNSNTGKVVIGNSTTGLNLDILGTGDATGLTNTGILEIGGTLRLDGNEIITNTGTILNLQAGNNGDLRVDGSTFVVDASTNRIGLGTLTPGVKLDIVGATDASGLTNTGLLELGGTLRLDGNEIITNTGTTLSLQAGNNGDLRIDTDTFFVDASTNRVGLSSIVPASKLHLYQNDTSTGATTGITIEQDGTGDSQINYLLTGSDRWVTGVDNSDGNKFKIGRGINWSSGPYITMDTSGNVVIQLGI